MMQEPKLRHSADFAKQFPGQNGKMKGYLKKHGVPKARVEDIVSEAWTHGLETFDPSHGPELVQWVWYILQHNLLPQYGRDRRTKNIETPLDDPVDENAGPLDESETGEKEYLIAFLKTHLPSDMLEFFNTIQDVTAETHSQHIYDQVASRLNITMHQCRNMVKRLRRHCSKLRTKYKP